MTKIDFKKELRELFSAPSGEFVLVTIPDLSYLAISGKGDPNTSEEYSQAVETLYPASYALKFASKNQLGKDYVVPPLEGLWWADDPAVFLTGHRDSWQWTMMIMIPEWTPSELVTDSIETVGRKKALPALSKLTTLRLSEGQSLQALHIGPYDAEGPLLARLHTEIIPESGFEPSDHHHEIYLSDPRKSQPQALRTILRQPVRPRREAGK